ncbi:TnsA endonuclease N-terminal domain-containing protein [Bacillus sp. Bva_UNVM-123]|uniref:TnsA endonuclease N-terminal domain-containing protein n=1 Tax=Bacillus sp. Bva_UNVM-123 TaxID=2829798 RepID=UPI00391F1913
MKLNLSDLYKRLRISEKAIQKIEDIRHSEPVRKVGSKAKNVSGVYPSKKMGLTIQFESRTLELASIYEKEFEEEVIEYYDQPSTFTIRYEHKGKNFGHAYTPDFFVIENDWIGWEEWKKEEEMPKLLERFPNRYHLDEMGIWHCPPAEKYAEQFGLSFRMRISNEINWTYQRNLRFLEDYLLEDHPSVTDQSKYIILCLVRENPGILLESLINLQAGFTSDDIYTLIATSEIYVELDHYLITEFDQFPLYLNKEVAETFRNISFANREDIYNTGIITVTPGQIINWGGNQCTVVNIGESEITILNGEQLVSFPHVAFEQLIKRNLIKSVSDLTEVKDNEVLIDLISSASPDELSKANVKYQLLQQYWAGNQNIETPARTLRYWDKQYRDAEEPFGDGYAGLLSSKHKQGNRKRKLDPNVIALMEEYINNRYENKKMSNVKSVYRLFEAECLKRGCDVPSYRTFVTEVSRRPKYEQENKRKGPKSAYKYEQFYYYLEETTPKHGERPFEICHLDHTKLDIELRCSETKKTWVIHG